MIKSKTIEKDLKLVRSFNTNNMYLFDDNLIPSKYKNVNDILLDFYDIRIDYYVKRRTYILDKLKKELAILDAKLRFIEEYINGKIEINRKSKEYIYSLLEERGYPDFGESYDYLVRMPILSFTKEKIEELSKQRDDKKQEVKILKNKTEKDLWLDDLENILKKLN